MGYTDMTADDVRALLATECAKMGSQAAWAKRAGLSKAYVSDVLLGRREPAKGVLGPLGLRVTVRYERIYSKVTA